MIIRVNKIIRKHQSLGETSRACFHERVIILLQSISNTIVYTLEFVIVTVLLLKILICTMLSFTDNAYLHYLFVVFITNYILII